MKKVIIYFISLVLCFAVFKTAFAQDITISTNTTWESGAYSYDNVLITNGAILSFNGAVIVNANNFTIDAGSSLLGDGKGYASGQGPGAGETGSYGYGGGGGYGGNGNSSYFGIQGGTSYGSLYQPTDLGSGGGGGILGGAGGGAIKLNILDTLTLNGTISTNGADGSPRGHYGGGGSGGSIWIITNNLIGNGIISANGGKGSTWLWSDDLFFGGAGAGGRIALYYDSSNFNGSIQAFGGQGYSQQYGGAGTIFIKPSNQQYGGLIIDNNGNPGAITQLLETDYNFDNFKVINNAYIYTDLTNNISSSNITLKNKATLEIKTNITIKIISDILSIEAGSKFSGNVEVTTANLTIDETSFISADGKGYGAASGPGAGINGSMGGSGAGYGGVGGNSSQASGGQTYGSAATPTDLGSGGGNGYGGPGMAGGGAIRLNVNETLITEGIISANGESAGSGEGAGAGGGSGGSIYITVKTFTGSGSIMANGGNGNPTAGFSGGGAGGRIAIYYQTSTFPEASVTANGASGRAGSGENGTIIFQEPSLDAPFTFFNLIEQSSTSSILSEMLKLQEITLNNATVSGDFNGNISFNNLEIVQIETGYFAGKGFSKGEFEAILEGVSYNGSWKGVTYFIPSEKKIYLKGEISGDISGIVEGYLAESIPETGIYDKYQATWRLNRLGADTTAAAINLEGFISYSPAYTFSSDLYLYQANMQGSCFGYYTGPLSVVITHLRLINGSEYKDEGLSIISYNSSLGQGEGWSYNQLDAIGNIEFQGLFKGSILGRLAGLLDESDSPKALSGMIERLDLGITPHPELKVKVWGPQNVSPGQSIDYIIGYRNDGLKVATEAIVYVYLDILVNYISSSQGAYYDPYPHQVSWNLGALPAKSVGYLSIQAEIPWALPQGLSLENRAYILDIVLHSSQENGFVNGISYNPENENSKDKYQKFASLNNAAWKQLYELYDKTNFITGVLEAYLASENVRTSRNGVGKEEDLGNIPGPLVIGTRPKWIGYSGGTTTLVNQAKNEKISGDELYLISLQVTTQQDLQATKSKFSKIVVYQGDDLVPNELTFETTTPLTTLLFGTAFIELFRGASEEQIHEEITLARNLVEEIEKFHGKELKKLKVFGDDAGNKVILEWTDDTSNEFFTTYTIQSEEGIEVITVPGIKHDEWIPVLTRFKEEYERLPTSEDIEKLKEMLEKFREENSSEMPQEITAARDPNEKLVSPRGNIMPGDRLDYTVNYENEGEGIAFGVYISDILEEDLDDSTLIINDGGAYDPQTRTITWFIGEVGPGEEGSVTFSVAVREDVLDNAEVINFATVYFPSVPEATRTNGTVNRVVTFIDDIAPTTTASVSPSPNQSGWNNSDVVIDLSAIDNEGGLGVKEIHYTLVGAVTKEETILGDTTQIYLTTEGITNLTYYAVDNADNVEAEKSIEIRIDKTPPEAMINIPLDVSEFVLNEPIFANWSVSDGLSGISSATGTLPNGGAINTATVGKQIFSVFAIDNAGNELMQTVIYYVRYSYSGILQPINPDGTSVFKLGRTVPVKFQLYDYSDTSIDTAVARIYLVKISDDIVGDEVEGISTSQATTGNLFRYDSTDNLYIFNLSTNELTSGTWQVHINLDDGTSKYVNFGLK